MDYIKNRCALINKALKQLVPDSYRTCRRYARKSGSSFVPAFRILPKRKRQAMEAVYAFMHFTDELADSDNPNDVRLWCLNRWRRCFSNFLSSPTPQNTLCGEMITPDGRIKDSYWFAEPFNILTLLSSTNTHPSLPLEGRKTILFDRQIPGLHDRLHIAYIYLLPALHDVIQRYDIPPEHFFAVIDGVEKDLDFSPFPNFKALAGYCDNVSTSVGFACLPIWGTVVPEEEYAESAHAAGLAFQLTNILRDIREDAENGRVYIPVDELQEAGFEDAEEFLRSVLRPEGDDRFEQLLQSQCRRVRAIYEDAAQLKKALSRDGRGIYRLMFDTYHGLFSLIEKEPTRVLHGKVRYSFLDKLRIAGKAVLHCRPFQ